MITCKILDSGNLLITANNETRKHIGEIMNDPALFLKYPHGLFDDLFYDYISNDSYTPFDAGDGRLHKVSFHLPSFVGWTCAPCIAEAMNYDEEGKPLIDGRLWWFPDYMIRDPLQELKNKGRVVFMLAERE